MAPDMKPLSFLPPALAANEFHACIYVSSGKQSVASYAPKINIKKTRVKKTQTSSTPVYVSSGKQSGEQGVASYAPKINIKKCGKKNEYAFHACALPAFSDSFILRRWALLSACT